MPGNSTRRGATRKTSKGNPTAGSGARVRRGLEGRGPTPKAKDREGHVKHKQAKLAARSRAKYPGRSPNAAPGRTTIVLDPAGKFVSVVAGPSAVVAAWERGDQTIVRVLE